MEIGAGNRDAADCRGELTTEGSGHMATLYKRGAGWSVQFDDPNGNRRTVSLGELPATAARLVRSHVETLIAVRGAGGQIPEATETWLDGIGDTLREKLVRVGLAESRRVATLGAFSDEFARRRTDWGAPMIAQFGLAMQDAKAFFGADRRLDSIADGEGEFFRAFLATKGLAFATIRKRVGMVKRLLRHAVQLRIIRTNPLADEKTASPPNPERMHYVTPDVAHAVLAELIGEARLVFVLGRFAGLRITSETHALKWSGVDFDRRNLRVFARKTKRTRDVPMTPAVYAELLRHFEDAPDGAEFVLQRRSPLPVVTRAFLAAIDRAGVERWPKVCHALRASFATDAARHLPAHVAAAILGHSKQVAASHYWMAQRDDIASAASALHGALQNFATDSGLERPKALPVAVNERHEADSSGQDMTLSVGAAGFEPA